MVVMPEGCTKNAFNASSPDSIPSGCSDSRGTTFNKNSSTTWKDEGLYDINANGVGFEANLGYSQPADYGLETVGLSYTSNGPALANQTVLGFVTSSPFYL